VSAEVRLTPRQAISRAPLRIQIPLSHTCPVCGGRGEVWTGRCAVCEGRGVAAVPHEIQLAVPAGLHDGMRLRYVVEPSFAPTTVLDIRFIIRQP
jgi:DnaJ-class molecular chaperone